MAQFVGREAEMEFLESIWNGSGPRACRVVGRRRIGKTELLKRFSEGKRSIYIGCIIGSVSDNIHVITTALNDFDRGNRPDPPFLSDSMNELLRICRESRTLVVIDELPYMIESGDQVASVLQHFVDAVKRDTDSMIIVCGSSVGMMDRETTDYSRPLYGRFNNELTVKPLTLEQCDIMHPRMSDLDRVKLYLTIGGIPQYHLDAETTTYRGYLEKHFLSENADMADEATTLIGSEFAPLGRYISIVNAISDGATSVKKISDKSNVQRATCTRCLDELEHVGIIGTVHPMMGSPKHPVYRIADPMVAFCQNIVRESKAYALRDPSEIYDILSQKIDTFLGIRFEDLCMDYVIRKNRCIEIGKWWGVNDDKETREIDVVARMLVDGSPVALLGECKFRTAKMTEGSLKDLMENGKLVKTDLPKRYILFSIGGFTEKLRDMAEEMDISLVDMDAMVGGMDGHDLG